MQRHARSLLSDFFLEYGKPALQYAQSAKTTYYQTTALHFTGLTYSAFDSLLSLVKAFGEEIEVWARRLIFFDFVRAVGKTADTPRSRDPGFQERLFLMSWTDKCNSLNDLHLPQKDNQLFEYSFHLSRNLKYLQHDDIVH